MRSVLCLLLVCGILAMPAFAANKNRIGTAGAQELLIPVGARGIAIGASGSVFMKGVDAIYWNPAGLGRMDRAVEVLFSQMSYIADIGVSYGGVGVQAGDFGNLGFTLKSLSFGDIPVTTVDFPDGTGEQYSPSYLTLGLTYGRLLTDRISVGATAYLISESIQNMSATGLAFDIGIQYHNLGIQGLMLSVAVKSIGPNMKFDGADAYVTANVGERDAQKYKIETAGFELPTNLEIGLGYSPRLDDKNMITIGGNFRNNNYLEDEYNLGAEYSFQNMLFVRGGYTFSPQTSDDITGENGYIYDFTAGAGLRYDVGGVVLGFDYAYRNVKYFDGNHVFTLAIGF
jgi:long-subunit fatty acid transport protein